MVTLSSNSWFSRDVTAAMLVYRTIAKKVFWEFDSIIMQNLNDILPLSCTPIWPSHHVRENQEYVKPAVLARVDANQFGTVPGSNTTIALISMLHSWLCDTDGNGATVRAILLDFRKAILLDFRKAFCLSNSNQKLLNSRFQRQHEHSAINLLFSMFASMTLQPVSWERTFSTI